MITVHAGKCPEKPQICMNKTEGDYVKLCEKDSECDDDKKCCFSHVSDACVRQCTAAETGMLFSIVKLLGCTI